VVNKFMVRLLRPTRDDANLEDHAGDVSDLFADR
jgi:hypothetical protein